MSALCPIFLSLSLFLIMPFAFSQQQSALFSFGIISDVQYADKEQAGLRNYRGTLVTLENTIAELNRSDVAFTVSLGDLVDDDFASFEKPLDLLKKSRAYVYHVFGNHDFMVDDKAKKKVAPILGNPKGYHAFRKDSIHFVILNGMDISLDGHKAGSKGYRRAEALLASLSASGANNARPWNGGIGAKQLAWLENELRQAEKDGMISILFCHFPLLPENGLQLLNHTEVLAVIAKFNCVKAFFSGHHHGGNYVLDNGVHHLTFYGMVESASPALGAVADVYSDRIHLRGIGHQEDRDLHFK